MKPSSKSVSDRQTHSLSREVYGDYFTICVAMSVFRITIPAEHNIIKLFYDPSNFFSFIINGILTENSPSNL